MDAADHLESLSNIICNPYAKDSARLGSIVEYSRILRTGQDVLDLPDVIQTYNRHMTDKFPTIIADPSENPETRHAILSLIVMNGLGFFAAVDQEIKDASGKLKPSFDLGGPNVASAIAKGVDFNQVLETAIQIAKNPKEPEPLRACATDAFNRIAVLAKIVFGQDIDRQRCNTRILATPHCQARL
jgi:hypothetical protein